MRVSQQQMKADVQKLDIGGLGEFGVPEALIAKLREWGSDFSELSHGSETRGSSSCLSKWGDQQ